MKNVSPKFVAVLVVSTLIFLPGCEWLKQKLHLQKSDATPTATMADVSDTSAVLATMDGKPIVTVKEFETQFKNLIETHPYGAMLAQMEGLERRFFDGLVSQKLMTRYVKEHGIDQKPEYKQQLDALVQMLNARFFQMENQPKVSESEIREHYNQNKETMPEAIMSRGGISTVGVSFTTEQDAKAFLEKAKGKESKLEQVAKEANLTDKYRDFKMINASSPIDPVLREKVVSIKKLPSLELVKVNDTTYYVVYASGKEEQKYRSYEEVKPAIEQRLSAKKQEEALEKAVESLKKQYGVTLNEGYFKKEAPQQQEDKEIENDEQLEMVMPEASAQENAQAKRNPPVKSA